MSSVTQVEEHLKEIMEERACVLARETGCIQRERKFSGADLVQTLVFGWLTHPDASLEQLASTAEVRHVSVSDTAIDKRFTPECAEFLHQVLQEMTAVVVQAEHEVPLPLLKRFSAVILEDASTITLPDELAEVWRGCGGNQSHTKAALKLHTRWELRRGQVQGPVLTDGRTSERISPLADEPVEVGSLYVADLGYFNLQLLAQRRQAGGYTLTREASQARRSTVPKVSASPSSTCCLRGWDSSKNCACWWELNSGCRCACCCCGCPRRLPTSGAKTCCAMRSDEDRRSAKRPCAWPTGRS